MRLKLMAAFAALLFSSCAMALDKANWNTDLEAAKAQAKKDGKDVFLLFSGSDWNSESQALAKDLLDQKDFLDFAKKNYILALAEFPEQKAMTLEQQAIAKKSIELSRSFQNNAIPAVIIMKPSGEVYIYLRGYDPMPLADFLSSLEKEGGVTKLLFEQEMGLADKSQGLERAKHLNTALLGLGQIGVFSTGADFGHDKTIDEIIALDKDNELHFRSAWTMYRTLRPIETALRGQDWASAQRLADGLITSFPKENDIVQKMYVLKSFAYRNSGDMNKGLECMKKCAEIDPESDLGKQAAQAVEQLTPKAEPLKEDDGK